MGVTEDQISIPGLENGGLITGPDPNIDNKEFIVVLTINKVDKVSSFLALLLRCGQFFPNNLC